MATIVWKADEFKLVLNQARFPIKSEPKIDENNADFGEIRLCECDSLIFHKHRLTTFHRIPYCSSWRARVLKPAVYLGERIDRL